MTDKPLEQEFLAFLEKRRQEMKEKYDRVLPTGELLFNRYDKAEYLGAGDGTSVYDTSVIMGDVRLGRHVWVGPYTLLEGVHAPVTIGNFVSVNSGVQIYSHDSTKYYVSGGRVPFKEGPVTVGDYTVIGSMSMISCGVTIGSHCVIGANSLVTRDIPDGHIAGGTPARLIGRVEWQDGDVRFRYF